MFHLKSGGSHLDQFFQPGLSAKLLLLPGNISFCHLLET
jgi:hypothetical protein